MRKSFLSVGLLALWMFALPALSETNAPGGIDNNDAGAGMNDMNGNGGDGRDEPAQPVPDVAPDIDAIAPSLPGDCKTINDELARLEKFAKNPKATPKQIAANQGRVDKLHAAYKDADCEDAAALQAESAAPAPAKK